MISVSGGWKAVLMMLVRMLLMKQEKKVSETGVLTSTCLLIYLYANLIFICPPGLRATACMSQTQHFLLLEGPHHLFIGQIRDYRGAFATKTLGRHTMSEVIHL